MRTEIFKPEHLELIDPLGDADIKNRVRPTLVQSITSDNAIAFTIFHKEKIISICGIYLLWPGVGEAFTVMCKDIKKYGLSLYKAYKITLPTVIKALKLKRLQAVIIVGFDEGVRFIEKLGFKREGIMKKWSPTEQDVYIYALVEG